MELADAPLAVPGPGQALVRIAASGVNFIDVYFRTGLYKAELPITQRSRRHRPVGRPERGAGIRGRSRCVRDGPRFMRECAAVPESSLVKIPDTIDFESAAAAMLQGMTAHYLTHSTFPLTRRSDVPGACGGRRHRTADRADGEDAQCACHRDRVDRRKSRGGESEWRRSPRSSTLQRISRLR